MRSEFRKRLLGPSVINRQGRGKGKTQPPCLPARPPSKVSVLYPCLQLQDTEASSLVRACVIRGGGLAAADLRI